MLNLGKCEPTLLSSSHNADVILFTTSQNWREGAVLLKEDKKCFPANPCKPRILSKILSEIRNCIYLLSSLFKNVLKGIYSISAEGYQQKLATA